jgi:hypothetical protein
MLKNRNCAIMSFVGQWRGVAKGEEDLSPRGANLGWAGGLMSFRCGKDADPAKYIEAGPGPDNASKFFEVLSILGQQVCGARQLRICCCVEAVTTGDAELQVLDGTIVKRCTQMGHLRCLQLGVRIS